MGSTNRGREATLEIATFGLRRFVRRPASRPGRRPFAGPDAGVAVQEHADAERDELSASVPARARMQV
jgi:hypothetical protein